MCKEDVVWILGDFGACFYNDERDNYVQNWWEKKNFTVISTIGNHDNWDIIYSLPRVKKFGGYLRQVRDNVFYAENGIFYIGGKTILNVNGADSHDIIVDGKPYRRQGIDWWKEEQITNEQVEYCKSLINTYQSSIDYVFSHTGGSLVDSVLGFKPTESDIQLDRILENLDFKKHYCGHMHCDILVYDKTRVFYKDIIEIY